MRTLSYSLYIEPSIVTDIYIRVSLKKGQLEEYKYKHKKKYTKYLNYN